MEALSKAQTESFLQRLRESVNTCLVYTITFMSLHERFTKTTVELPLPHLYDDGEMEEELTRELTSTKSINWCRTTTKLAVLRNKSKGRSSFLQSISKSLWNLENRETETFLQQLMDTNMAGARESARYKERWEKDRTSYPANNISWSRYSTSSLRSASWEEVCKAFQDVDGVWEGRTGDVDSTHIFTMSNLIKRPIVLIEVQETEEDNETSKDYFSSLFLPSLLRPNECVKQPLILAYKDQRFYPVVVQPESDRNLLRVRAVPLVTDLLQQFPIRCLSEEERQKQGFALVQSYLNVEEIPYTGPSTVNHVLTARLTSCQPDFVDLDNHFLGGAAMSFTRPGEEPKQSERKGVNDYTGMIALSSGLRCSEPQCNELVDLDSFPRCRLHAASMKEASGTAQKKKNEITISSLRPEIGDLEKAITASLKCINVNCDREGSREYEGRCRICYVRGSNGSVFETVGTLESGGLKSTEELAREITSKEVTSSGRNYSRPLNSATTSHEGVNETSFERQISEQAKCIVPVCNSKGMMTYNGLCGECFTAICNSKAEKEKANTQVKGRAQGEELSGSGRSSVVVETRIVTSRSKCLTEGCHSPVDNQDLGLCFSCLDQQRQAQQAFERKRQSKEISRTSSAPLASGTQRRPSSSISGVCQPSDEWNRPLDLLPGQSRVSASNSPKQKTPSWSSMRPEEIRAKMCLSSSCDRFGDPGFGGLCSVCYLRQN